MNIKLKVGNEELNVKNETIDSNISIEELKTQELKINYLNLFLKSNIAELIEDSSITQSMIDATIDSIDLAIFINDICENDEVVKKLLIKNIIFVLERHSGKTNVISFNALYKLLSSLKSKNN